MLIKLILINNIVYIYIYNIMSNYDDISEEIRELVFNTDGVNKEINVWISNPDNYNYDDLKKDFDYILIN